MRLKHSCSVLLLFLLFCGIDLSVAQKGTSGISLADSLLNALKTFQYKNNSAALSLIADTMKSDLLNDLAWELKGNNPDTAIILSTEAISIAEKVTQAKDRFLQKTGRSDLANSYRNLGVFNHIKGNYSDALSFYFKALEIYKKGNIDFSSEREFKQGISSVNGNIGIVFKELGDYPKALNYYYMALRMDEALDNKSGIARHLGNIAIVYVKQKNFSKALEYHLKALQLDTDRGNKSAIARHYGNIGLLYSDQIDLAEKPDQKNELCRKALDYYFKALKIAEETGEKSRIAAQYGNIGSVYNKQTLLSKDSNKFFFQMAEDYYLKALELNEKLDNKKEIATQLGNIGSLYINVNNREAESYLKKALTISEKLEAKDLQKSHYEKLSALYTNMGKYELAYDYYKKYINNRDLVFNEENTKKTVQSQMQYDFDKKEAATQAEQEKKDAVAAAEKKRQNTILVLICLVLVLVVVFAIYVFRSLGITRKQKELIENQKHMVELQKELVEEKQKEILDSIYYARRIQRSLLPTEKYIQRNLKRLQ